MVYPNPEKSHEFGKTRRLHWRLVKCFLPLVGSAAAARLWTSSFAPSSRRPRTGLVVLLARQRGSRFLRVSPMLREDLLDVVGRSYDDVDHVVLDDVHETMLDPCKSDHPLAAAGVVAQTT